MPRPWLTVTAAALLCLGCTQTPDSPTLSPVAPPQEPLVEQQVPNLRSAIRLEGESYEEAVLRHDNLRAKHLPEYASTTLLAATVKNSQVAVAQADLSRVPVWSDANIKAHFDYSRDLRFQTASNNPNFQRRLTWLYPDDGCYARAELVCSKAAESGLTRPYKLFSFGNLAVRTTNHPNGQVSWWYHVVPVVKSASTNECLVLDAAIDPSKPLPWKDWLLKQVPALTSVKVTVADTNAYDPDSPVTGGANQVSTALSDQKYTFLQYEWDRQVALGRDPNKVLGANPPWLGTSTDTVAPTTSLTSPGAGSTLTGTVTLSASASDTVGVTKVDFYVGTKLVGTDTTAPYSIAWDSKSVANGSYALSTRAFDAAGNMGTSANVTVTISNVTVQGSEVEPNNSSTSAQALSTSGMTIQGTMGSSTDVDFFSVSLAPGRTLAAVMTPNASSD